MEMPSLTKEQIKTAEYLGVPREYGDAVINNIINSGIKYGGMDYLIYTVKNNLAIRFIESKRAFRRACHEYEKTLGKGE